MGIKNETGFTLIEMMMALVIGIMITGGAYSIYTTQQQSYYAQDQVAEMQQNLRAAFTVMVNELRMAGYDPQVTGNFGITSALAGRVQFTTDTDQDGIVDANETIDIGYSTTVDADGDGLPNANPDPADIGIQRGGAGGFQDIAENIQAVEFLYLDENDAVTAVLADIRSIQITLLARSSGADGNYLNSSTYTASVPSGMNLGPYNDNFRRRIITIRLRCRNLGLGS
ncbi:MAG: prepilin-type N-terminal cleavage/methylation domain-containing protein [Desulfobacterales bacterium]|nr:prepilin-type N-terminal cleavage/methylation domain-containing protein [Desulfobacterales bacterium]